MRRGKWWFCLTGAATIGAASAGACRQAIGLDAYISGVSDAGSIPGPSSDLDASACGLSYGTGICAACAASHCCDPSNACAQDLQCSDCLGACGGDAGCQGTCIAQSFVSSPTGADLAACLAQSCRSECNFSCGAMAAYLSPPAQASACETCLGPNACPAEHACATSADCQAYAQCLHACFAPDCREHCASLHEAGAPLFAPLAAAATGACATACAYGQDWSCLGHVRWPAPNATTTDLRFLVNAYPSHMPIAGANVSVCFSVNQFAACVSPLANGTTNGGGSVDLSVMTETASIPPSGLVPQILLSGAGYSPTYLDLDFPLSEPVFTFPPSLSDLFSLSPSFFGLVTGVPPAIPGGLGGPGGPPAVAPADAGTPIGAVVDGGPPYGELVVYVVDCQGNPATGVSGTVNTPSLGCISGALPQMCPTYTATSIGNLPGILEVHVPSGFINITVSLVAPPPPDDAGPKPLQCCSFLTAGPSPFPGGPPAGGASDGGAVDAGDGGAVDAGDAAAPHAFPPLPGGSYTDAGIPCFFSSPDGGGDCVPTCSTDPGCTPVSSGPPLLDGGQIGSFSVTMPDWAVTGVWLVPQPR